MDKRPDQPRQPQDDQDNSGNRDSRVQPAQRRDTAFLADSFDMTAAEAAALVADRPLDDETTTDLARTVREADDPLADVPTPKEPARDFVADSDEHALKPVLHRANQRQGAG
jgi:hypothetical protein